MDLTSRRLTATAGWIGVAFGTAHSVIAPLGTPVRWSEIFSEGWWGTFTLRASTTTADLQRAETFWISIGSFGVPMLALGSLTVWAARNEVRVPGGIGYLLGAWGLVLSTSLPASPGWALPVMGALLVAADARLGRSADPRSAVGAAAARG
jgi:hypothetical protein